MSTNLFPRTDNTTIRERLAGVPQGTGAAHAAWYAVQPPYVVRFESREAYEADIAAFEAWDAAATEAVHRYHYLHYYGFGRITIAAWHLAVRFAARDHGDPSCHEIADPRDIEPMLMAQGIILPTNVTVADLGGLFWS